MTDQACTSDQDDLYKSGTLSLTTMVSMTTGFTCPTINAKQRGTHMIAYRQQNQGKEVLAAKGSKI
jgi:hypothetical protein